MELLPLLFMSSCFLTLSGLTFGDQSGTSVIVKEGDDAILPCSLDTNIEFVQFEWTKEGTEKKVFTYDTGMVDSPALPGRVSHFPDDLQHGSASIKINNVRLEDGGNYTCYFPTRGKTFRIELVVVTSVTKVTVKEDDDAILPCSLGTNENIQSQLFDWKMNETVNVFVYNPHNNRPSNPGDNFKGRVSHFPEELKHGNASIRISQTKWEDRGNYKCIFPHMRTFFVELVVEHILKVRKFQGAAPEPYVTILKEKGLLQCKVPGAFPKPTVEWWDSDNKKLPSKTVQDEEEQGRFHVTVQTTVTEPGCYHCVATQMEKWHRISSEICVHHEKSDSAPQVLPVWAAILIGVIVAVVKV